MELIQEHWLSILIGTTIILLLVKGPIMRRVYGIANISSTELEKKLKENNIVLIDVRTEGEFKSGHIKGAKLIPLHEISAKAPTIVNQFANSNIAVICATGARSTPGAVTLKKAGISNVFNVKGGMVNCNRNDFEIVHQ